MLIFLLIGMTNTGHAQQFESALVNKEMSDLIEIYKFTGKQQSKVKQILLKKEADILLVTNDQNISKQVLSNKLKAIEKGSKASVILLMTNDQRKIEEQIRIQERIQRSKTIKKN